MKIAVIGGTGLIGSRVVELLRAAGHQAAPHSPSTGLDLLSGKGVAEALANLLKAGPIPWSIVRATQFFEFVDAVLAWTGDADTVRLPATPIQPMAADDVARAVAEVSAGTPLNGTRDIAGPEIFTLDELGRITLEAEGDKRAVVTDPSAGMFAAVPGDVIIAREGAVIAKTSYREWLAAR